MMLGLALFAAASEDAPGDYPWEDVALHGLLNCLGGIVTIWVLVRFFSPAKLQKPLLFTTPFLPREMGFPGWYALLILVIFSMHVGGLLSQLLRWGTVDAEHLMIGLASAVCYVFLEYRHGVLYNRKHAAASKTAEATAIEQRKDISP